MGMWIRTWDWNWAQKNTSIYLFNEGIQWIPNTVDDSKKLQTLWVKASKTYNSSSWGTAGAFIALSPDRIDTFCFWRYVAILGSRMFANSDLLNFVQSLLDTRTRFPMGHPERSIQFLTSLIWTKLCRDVSYVYISNHQRTSSQLNATPHSPCPLQALAFFHNNLLLAWPKLSWQKMYWWFFCCGLSFMPILNKYIFIFARVTPNYNMSINKSSYIYHKHIFFRMFRWSLYPQQTKDMLYTW